MVWFIFSWFPNMPSLIQELFQDMWITKQILPPSLPTHNYLIPKPSEDVGPRSPDQTDPSLSHCRAACMSTLIPPDYSCVVFKLSSSSPLSPSCHSWLSCVFQTWSCWKEWRSRGLWSSFRLWFCPQWIQVSLDKMPLQVDALDADK